LSNLALRVSHIACCKVLRVLEKLIEAVLSIFNKDIIQYMELLP